MADRPRRRRLRRTLLAALVTFAVAVPVSGAARPAAVPAPAPTVLGPLRDADPAALEERYAVSRRDIRAAGRVADGHGDLKRAASLRAMAVPGRQFLAFDGRDGGRSVEVVGELSTARRVAVLVPGAGIGLDAYGRLRRGAVALQGELGDGGAVVAWLGYRSPATVSPASLTEGRATEAAPGLRALVDGLSATLPGARVTLLCHSYGSVICARAASGTSADAIVLYGSPGTGAQDVASCVPGRGSGPVVAAGTGSAGCPMSGCGCRSSRRWGSGPIRWRTGSGPRCSTRATVATATICCPVRGP